MNQLCGKKETVFVTMTSSGFGARMFFCSKKRIPARRIRYAAGTTGICAIREVEVFFPSLLPSSGSTHLPRERVALNYELVHSVSYNKSVLDGRAIFLPYLLRWIVSLSPSIRM